MAHVEPPRVRAVLLAVIVVIAAGCIPVGPKNTTSGSWRQDTPKIASDGVNTLVVWRDYRDGVGNGQIFGSIVAPDSSVVVADIAISTQPGTESSPAVAFDGTGYIVAWGDRRGGDADLYAARVSTTGDVLDPDGVLVAGGAYDQRRPALASDGSNVLIVYEETSNLPTSGISAKRVTHDLTVLDASAIQLATANKDALFPDVVHDGTGFVAGWTETVLGNSDVVVRAISSTGSPGPLIELTSDSTDHLDVAMTFDGTNTMVVYTTFVGAFSTILHGQRVSTSGTIVDSTPVEFEHDPGEFDFTPRSADVAWDGTAYTLTFTIIYDYDRRTYVVRVDASGARVSDRIQLDVVRSDLFVDTLDQPSVAVVGDEIVVAMEGSTYDLDFIPAVFAASVDGANETSPGTPLAGDAANQRPEAIAYGAGVHLVVWSDFTGVYAARFDDQLGSLDAVPIALGAARRVEVVFTGSNFLVISARELVTIRPDGTIASDVILPPLTSGGISISAQDAATSGGDTLIVRSSPDVVEAMLVDADGNLITASTPVVVGDSIRDVSAAWDGSRFHVVWADLRNGDFDIYGTRVAADASPLDMIGTPIAFGPGHQTEPQIAASNGSVAVLWTTVVGFQDYRLDTDRISSNGTPTGTSVEVASGITAPPGARLAVSNHFVAVWGEPDGTEVDIEAARLTNTAALSRGTVTRATITDDVVGSAQRAVVDLAATQPGVVALLYRDVDDIDGADGAFWRVLYS